MEPTEELPVPASAPPTDTGTGRGCIETDVCDARTWSIGTRENSHARSYTQIDSFGCVLDSRSDPKSTGAAPPSAWQRLRNIPSVLSLSAGRRSSTESDATSAYHTAQGHPTPAGTGSGGAGTPVTDWGECAENSFGPRVHLDNARRPMLASSSSSKNPDPLHQPSRPGSSAYIEAGPSQPSLRPRLVQFDSSSVGHSDPDTSSAGGHFPRDSGNWDSTASSAMLQTWETARRPTGFVGLGEWCQAYGRLEPSRR
ncbi:stress response protein NST1 [Ceratobasidium sp. AG-Ba]|nr:stress response protein NST1 [Ceratobasidium sp. AG-Ba]